MRSSQTMKTIIENRKLEIVLVEEEDTLRRSIAFTLIRHGYTVIPFATADEALLFLSEVHLLNVEIVLIITDLELPKQNGLKLLRQIREQYKEIPVLVITGHGSREARNELEKLGEIQVLDKPFDLEELVTRVRNILLS